MTLRLCPRHMRAAQSRRARPIGGLLVPPTRCLLCARLALPPTVRISPNEFPVRQTVRIPVGELDF